MSKIFKIKNIQDDIEEYCPYCGYDVENHWHELIDANKNELTYECKLKNEWIGADTSLLVDSCKYEGTLECYEYIDKCTRNCAKFNCGAVMHKCKTCGSYYYDPTGCWQYGHNIKKCNCYNS
ncbi:MAG: hypothetical protein ACE5J3_09610 [Methanosarcinales archaeon]